MNEEKLKEVNMFIVLCLVCSLVYSLPLIIPFNKMQLIKSALNKKIWKIILSIAVREKIFVAYDKGNMDG